MPGRRCSCRRDRQARGTPDRWPSGSCRSCRQPRSARRCWRCARPTAHGGRPAVGEIGSRHAPRVECAGVVPGWAGGASGAVPPGAGEPAELDDPHGTETEDDQGDGRGCAGARAAWVGPIRDRRSPSASGGTGRRAGVEHDATRIQPDPGMSGPAIRQGGSERAPAPTQPEVKRAVASPERSPDGSRRSMSTISR
jgi:hypothetical protein